MITNYDEIADDYLKAKSHPIKTYLETFTFLTLLGDVQAKSVLDLACGDGYYTRLIKEQGAVRVIGVDISETMIDNARKIEGAVPLGLEYRVQDVARLGQIGQFDLVTALWLLPYASTKQVLTTMCQTAYDNLKPGGKLIAITLNPRLSGQDLTIYSQYGVHITADETLTDGTTVTTIVDIPDGSFELLTHYWTQETYETSLKRVGFQEIIWHPLRVSEEGLKTYGADYWQALLTRPYAVVLECRQ